MNNRNIMEIMGKVGAIITNSHIVYTSGRHGTDYVNKDALYPHIKDTKILCQEMAAPYLADQIDVVAGPTIGGVILSQWVAYYLSQERASGEVLSIYAEEEGEGQAKKRLFKRGYDLFIPGKNVLVVEDVLNTGGSARKVIEAVHALKGKVIGLSVLCNRGGIQPRDVGDVPIHALVNVTLDSWTEEECPLCKDQIPVNTTVGKGRAFLEKKRAHI